MDSPSAFSIFIDAFELFRDPLLCALIAGGVLGFLGVYVVLKRMIFVSATVTQAAGLGVALAFYAEIHLGMHLDPIFGAAAMALIATLALVADPQRLRLSREGLLGVAYALTGGLAVLVGDRISQEAHDIQSILFGTAVLVRPFDLAMVAAVGAFTLAIHLWWFRGMTFASFDPIAAHVQGVPVRLLDSTLLLTVGLMVGVSARALGALPVFAFTTLAAVAALVLDLALPWTFVIAALAGATAGVGGYMFAYFAEFPVGGSQTLVAGALIVPAILYRLIRRALSRGAG